MYCVKCGNNINEGDIYCSKCGNKIENNEFTEEKNESLVDNDLEKESIKLDETDEIIDGDEQKDNEMEGVDSETTVIERNDKGGIGELFKEFLIRVFRLLKMIGIVLFAKIKDFLIYIFNLLKDRFRSFWEKQTQVGKVLTVLTIIWLIFFIIEFANKMYWTLFLNVAQFGFILLLWLVLYERLLTDKKKYILYWMIVLLLMVPQIASLKEKIETTFISSDSDTVDVNYKNTIEELNDNQYVVPTVKPNKNNAQNINSVKEKIEILFWPTDGLATMLPIPDSEFGKIITSANGKLIVEVHYITNQEFENYITSCFGLGFTDVKNQKESYYEAVNAEGYNLKLEFKDTEKMKITLQEPILSVELNIKGRTNLFLNTYDVILYVDDKKIEEIPHGGEYVGKIELTKGNHKIEIENKDDYEIVGRSDIIVSSDLRVGYEFWCNTENVTLKQLEYTELRELNDDEVMILSSPTDFSFSNYKEVVSSFENAGFTNVKTKILYDIVFGFTDEGEVESVTVDSNEEWVKGTIYPKDVEVVITYHMGEEDDPSRIKMIQNSTYYEGKDYKDVEKTFKKFGFSNVELTAVETSDNTHKEGDVSSITVDSEKFSIGDGYLPTDKVLIKYYVFNQETRIAAKVNELQMKVDKQIGCLASEVLNSMKNEGCEVTSYIQGKEVNDFDFESFFLEKGTVEEDGKTVNLYFTDVNIRLVEDNLKRFIPKETAEKVAVVAMTNGQANDVFNSDGYTYNVSKFHRYSDMSGFYLSVVNNGEWEVLSDTVWHVDGMKFMISGYDTWMKASMDITFDGVNYQVSNVKKIIAHKEYLDSSDSSKINEQYLDDSRNYPYLKVSPSLVNCDRDLAQEINMNNKTMMTDTRKRWIDNQFSFFSGEHKDLKSLIKEQLNDEKSYKHIETSYVDIKSNSVVDEMNGLIKNAGYSDSVEIGDLLVICKFSAKNAFNATIKNTAYAIVSYDLNAIKLIGID